MSGVPFADYAFIGLGANLPRADASPAATLQAATRQLQHFSAAPLLVSPFYVSDPKDCPPGSPLYINAVAGLLPQKGESPESLLVRLQALEHEYDRRRSGVVNESRTLDLDLLVFAAARRDSARLTLPHPRACERRFVLEPWMAIAGPDFLLSGTRLGDWLAQNDDPLLQPVSVNAGKDEGSEKGSEKGSDEKGGQEDSDT